MKKGYSKKQGKPLLAKAYAGEIPEMKPRMSIDSKDLPEIKNWKIDKEYTVTVNIKMIGIHKRYEGDGVCADFEVLDTKESK